LKILNAIFYFQNEVLSSIADLYEEHNQCSQGHRFCSCN